MKTDWMNQFWRLPLGYHWSATWIKRDIMILRYFHQKRNAVDQRYRLKLCSLWTCRMSRSQMKCNGIGTNTGPSESSLPLKWSCSQQRMQVSAHQQEAGAPCSYEINLVSLARLDRNVFALLLYSALPTREERNDDSYLWNTGRLACAVSERTLHLRQDVQGE